MTIKTSMSFLNSSIKFYNFSLSLIRYVLYCLYDEIFKLSLTHLYTRLEIITVCESKYIYENEYSKKTRPVQAD